MISPLLSAELRRFCETTSVRGVSRIIKSKSTGLFIIWLLGVLTCSGFLIWQLVVVCTRYSSYRVNTLLVQSPIWDNATFPDITVCNLCPLAHESDMSFYYIDYLSKIDHDFTYDSLLQHFTRLNNASLDIDSYYNFLIDYYVTPTAYLNNLPILGVYNAEDLNPSVVDYSYFNWDYTPHYDSSEHSSSILQKIWDPDYYFCYLFKPADFNRKNVRGFSTILYVDYFLDSAWQSYYLDLIASRSTGMRVMIHPPGTVPNMKLGISIAPGMDTTITLSQTSYSHLPAPYSNCTTQEIIGPSIDNKTNASYTVDYCLNVCLQEQYLENCGCITSYLQFSEKQLIEANYTICGNLGITEENSAINWEGVHQLLCATELSADENACHAECLTPCQEIKYSTSVTEAPWPHMSAQMSFWFSYIKESGRFDNSKFDEYGDVMDLTFINESAARDILRKLDNEGLIRDNFLQLNVRFDSQTYMEQKDVAAMSFDAFGAQIGGVLSLWLGVTVILVFELCEFLFNLVVICYHESKSKRESACNPAVGPI